MVGALDSSLKFALTALWNLTDEMPSAGRSFIECRGLELYQEVLEVREQADQRNSEKHIFPHGGTFLCFLQSYYGEPSIQQKILGLLVSSESVWKHAVHG